MSTLDFMRAVCFCQFFSLSLVHSQCAWLGCRVPLTDSRHLRRPGVDICVPGGLKPVVRALEDQKVRAHRLPPSLPPAHPPHAPASLRRARGWAGRGAWHLALDHPQRWAQGLVAVRGRCSGAVGRRRCSCGWRAMNTWDSLATGEHARVGEGVERDSAGGAAAGGCRLPAPGHAGDRGPPPFVRILRGYAQVALLLVVAGYQHLDSLADVDAAGLRQHFEVNAIGPLMAVQALRPWLAAASKARAGRCCAPAARPSASTVSRLGCPCCRNVQAALGRRGRRCKRGTSGSTASACKEYTVV